MPTDNESVSIATIWPGTPGRQRG